MPSATQRPFLQLNCVWRNKIQKEISRQNVSKYRTALQYRQGVAIRGRRERLHALYPADNPPIPLIAQAPSSFAAMSIVLVYPACLCRCLIPESARRPSVVWRADAIRPYNRIPDARNGKNENTDCR
jgi:hypothetical protein